MNAHRNEEFTRYEVARILGARALQIAMDAPILLKIDDKALKDINYDSLEIAKKEFDSGVLPIVVDRPLPKRKESKLEEVKQEKIDDSEIIAKEREVEREIAEKAEELGFVENDEEEGFGDDLGNGDKEG